MLLPLVSPLFEDINRAVLYSTVKSVWRRIANDATVVVDIYMISKLFWLFFVYWAQ